MSKNSDPKKVPENPDPKPEPPASPKIVQKTREVKTPREIQLEKELAATQDRLSRLESWREEMDRYLAENLPPPRRGSTESRPTSGLTESRPTKPDEKPRHDRHQADYERWLAGEF